MNTFVFIWNNEKWFWKPTPEHPEQKTLAEAITEVEESGVTFEKWNCRHHKKIKPGDKAFLAVTGNTNGIFGSGIICNDLPFEEPDERLDVSKLVTKVWIQIDVLLDPGREPFLTYAELTRKLPQYKTPRSSGESINNETAEKLDSIWNEFLNGSSNTIVRHAGENSRTFIEGAPRTVTQTTYERDRNARNKCIEHYGLSCVICEFNFEDKYGPVGKDYIHVHHLTQIASYGASHEIDPIEALRPVCPNCHSIIHKRKEAYTIEEVRLFIQRG